MLVLMGEPDKLFVPGYIIDYLVNYRCLECGENLYSMCWPETGHYSIACYTCKKYSPFQVEWNKAYLHFRERASPMYILEYYTDRISKTRFK